ncbi:Soluble aldose sugar dehydrogenase YliI precursor [Luteitalea pratensis]|uniref:Soluble aldose sugar dehydrogenase YliI n=1 Tax=Luteitalea pratensis TaxID=1855912 RepID=A0A143PJ81_LUTPR|nr:PQQ-dependent sugar dehydrogenase [Luteitalea pratensis]AMY08466.1 Soluble aldose sugar dehydrogenase YliI precursor [Luteitalea pratensis]
MRSILAVVVLVPLVAGCDVGAASQAPGAAQPPANLPFQIQVVADFESPWAMTFLPDGRMLITEKAGTLYVVSADGQQRKRVDGIPAVASEGQGGFMDVVVHPGFATNRLVYFSYAEAGQGGKGVVLARGVFVDGEQPVLQKVETLFRASPYVDGNGHFSGRIAFSSDGHLFFTNGERQKFDPAQDPKATLGKVLRLQDDGTPAPGNPLVAKGFHPAVWSYGHRNLLGLAFDASGNLWKQEMGPRGGDEVNLILPGRNYGYPIVSDGDHYDGKSIPDHATRPEFEKPKVSWNPVISPGGLMVYSGKLWPQWKGDLFIGGLSSQSLIRVDVDGTNARKGDQWPMGQRIREPEEGPDGAIWLLEDGGRDGQGRLLKLTPLGSASR